MLKKTISLILILISYLIICYKIYINYTYQEKAIPKQIITNNKNITKKETPYQPIYQAQNTAMKENHIGKLIIEKINLNNLLYPINSSKNNIEQNVTILKNSEEPSNNNSIMFIAAHSGTGKIAYFKNLDKLQINDIIKLEYKNIKYTYQIKDIWEVKKTGTINVEKENNIQLILTTCSPNKKNYQLIINSIQIKKES